MRLQLLASAVILAVVAATVTACGGGGATNANTVQTTTVGQQLIDLKKALDSGAITEAEYERQRKKILSQ